MSKTLAKIGVRALEPVSRARIAVLIAVALPVFGGLYYSLLNFLLFG
jgi:hypothetical protein